MFKRLTGFEDELARLRNNLAYLNANLGKMENAHNQANAARRTFVRLGNQEGEAWALSTLAMVEIRAGDYTRAIRNATDALNMFDKVSEQRGIVMALLARAQAGRKQAKSAILAGSTSNWEPIKASLQSARDDLDRAIDLAARNGLTGEFPRLFAKRGKVYREMGMLAKRANSPEEAEDWFRRGKQDFERALNLSSSNLLGQLDTRVDFAEWYFRSGNPGEARKLLLKTEEKLPRTTQPDGLKPEYCTLRGKTERLRGEMAQEQGQIENALKHYICAYSYFHRFSPVDRRRRSMANRVQEILLALASTTRHDPIGLLSEWIDVEHPQPDKEIREYVERL